MPVKRADTVEHILDGAEQAFAERGFHGASIGYICQRAEKTTGAFYSNWSTKLDLFLDVYRRHTDQIAEDIADRLSRVQPGAGALTGLAAAFADIAAQAYDPHWLALNIEFRLLSLRDSEAATALAEYETRFVHGLGGQVDALLASAPARPQLTGAHLIALVGALVRGLRLDHPLLRDALPGPAETAMVFHALLTGGPAA